ncbi:aldo/keto reductase [Methanogenium organophilum]|uniref:Aldo/keto reductase n=1 Tax=Methanogenium organophilum TaxID=2199 RepID=A0A9X9S5V5_METOG|nr:aldo/keto reductase [Methanogenium organophilum]WAI02313.1 aldo/keto reductase [Methanogenium organophilum]
MLYRTIPKTGDKLSILGYGCMRLPEVDGKIDEERATRQLRYAIDHGMNYVDTAWSYHMGESEPFVGRALGDGYREKVRLATKLPSWLVRTRGDMDRFLDAQLTNLQTDHIDYYLIHVLNTTERLAQLEACGLRAFLDEAKKAGKIVNAGFSFHGPADDFAPIVDAYPWEFCQIQYNILDEENQAGTKGLEYAAGKGLGVIIMEPLRGGNLTDPVPPEVGDIWDRAPVERTPAEWGLRWVWNHPEVTVVLSGMNREEDIEENIRTAGEAYPGSLSETELSLIAKATDTYRELMKVGCTGCQYCMPCPAGVDIPLCFELYNNKYMFKNPDAEMFYVVRLSGVLTSGPEQYASQCVQCMECLDKCPQHLDIPALLETIVEEMEGEGFDEKKQMAREMFAE